MGVSEQQEDFYLDVSTAFKPEGGKSFLYET